MSEKKKVFTIIISLIVLCILCTGLIGYVLYRVYQYYNDNGSGGSHQVVLPKLSDSMQTFADNNEFDDFVSEVENEIMSTQEDSGGFNLFGGFGDTAVESPAMEEKSSDTETITNVQEAGVDEGDIIKSYKNYLVILRRGKIFSVNLNNEDNSLKTVDSIKAYPEGFTQGTWYDEMLIYNNKVIVIGYTYQISATEIGIFQIDDFGRLTHIDSYYIDSNDYYSSRNYASRLVDNQLIFYMPYYLFSWDYNENGDYARVASFPEIKKWLDGNNLSEGKEILAKTDIFKPVQDSYSPTLHTIVKCNLDSINFDCKAKAILGPYSRTFYVSPNSVYIWVSGQDGSYYLYEEESSTEERDDKSDSYVYMFKLDDLSARSLIADGSPIDQFSFKEDNEGYLNVLVREYTAGDAMWNAEATSGKIALLKVSLSDFSDKPAVVTADRYKALPEPDGYTFQNRFVNDYLLYGTGGTWYYSEKGENKVFLVNYKSMGEVYELSLEHSVDRIEVMGDGAVVIGTDNNNLLFSSVELSSYPSVQDTYKIPGAKQGELRSHGFYYKEYADRDYGILGLPIRGEGESYTHLWDDSAQIVFLRVDSKKDFSLMGTLDGTPPEEENDSCSISCTDWYGNSRPIFYDDRIFGLLGYELVEGSITSDNNLKEISRLNYQSEITSMSDLKSCSNDEDCVTSCGIMLQTESRLGRGECYNKNLATVNNLPSSDKTCCVCENCVECIQCKCINNLCTKQSAEADCC